MVEVSVVVPSRNGGPLLGWQLDALAQQSYAGSWEIVVVVGNPSAAASLQLSRRQTTLPGLVVVELPRQVNAAAARNIGVAKASGDKLLFCDDDDVVDHRWVEVMAAALDRHSAVAGRRDMEALNPDWVVASRAHAQQAGLQRWDNPPWLTHAGGGNLGVRRAAFEEVGGFDERLSVLEDTALCFALQLRGHGLAYDHDAVVQVRMRDTLRGVYRQARNWAEGSVALHDLFAREMPRPTWLRGLLAWPVLVVRLLGVRRRADLAGWLFRLGWRVGRLRGSLRYRIPAF